MTKVPQSTWSHKMFGILNAEGKPWTPQVFESLVEAETYLLQQRHKRPEWNLSKHRVAPISVTVRAIKTAE